MWAASVTSIRRFNKTADSMLMNSPYKARPLPYPMAITQSASPPTSYKYWEDKDARELARREQCGNPARARFIRRPVLAVSLRQAHRPALPTPLVLPATLARPVGCRVITSYVKEKPLLCCSASDISGPYGLSTVSFCSVSTCRESPPS